MKIEKKLIKELVDNLKEFNLTELNIKMVKQKLKCQKLQRIEQSKTSAVSLQIKLF